MDEMRDGFLVTEGRKQLWKVELELIDLVEAICSKHDLNYFLIGGAAIGAVRHGGFIPWDDDMDIGMLRDDFEKFISVAQNELPGYIVVEYGLNNPKLSATFLRIRNTETTAIIVDQYHIEREHGIFIEIYPFDRVPKNNKRRKAIRKASWQLSELNHRIEKRKLHKKAMLRHIYYQFISTKKMWEMWIETCTMFNGDSSCEMVDTLALPGYANQGIHFYHLEDVASSKYVDFEGHRLRVAKGYDRCLQIHFGDYMRLPPVEERGMKHSVTVFYDAFKPWHEYMVNQKDVVDRFFAGDFRLSNIW